MAEIVPKKPVSPGAQIPVPAGVRAVVRHVPPPAVNVVLPVTAVADSAHLTTPDEADLFEMVNEVIAAFAGETDVRTPIPRAVTATSAMRL
jgi:hypothetical protein